MSGINSIIEQFKGRLDQEDRLYWEPIKMVLENAVSEGYVVANLDEFPYLIVNEEYLPKGVSVTDIGQVIRNYISVASEGKHHEKWEGFSIFRFKKEFDLEKAQLDPAAYLDGGYFMRGDEFARYASNKFLPEHLKPIAIQLIAEADANFETSSYDSLESVPGLRKPSILERGIGWLYTHLSRK